MMISTGDEPKLETFSAEVIADSATIKGTIHDSGGKEISEYGFLWGPTPDKLSKETIDSKIEANITFSLIVNELETGNTYYYQAFAINSKGIGLGEIKSFSITKNISPEVSLISPSDNLSIIQGDIVPISATATDDKKVESISLYINDNLVIEVPGDSFNYDWNTNKLDAGEYSLKLAAWDGSEYSEKVINIQIKEKAKPEIEETSTTTKTSPESNTNRNTNSNNIKHTNTNVSRGTTDINKYPRLSKVNGSFGQYRYRSLSGGRIEIDPIWVQENIVTITLPGLNQQVQVHKDAKDNFIYAFTLIRDGYATINGQKVPLLSLIKTMDGTFVPRHVNWDSSRGLSNHSWGTAIDINAAGHFRYVDPTKEANNPNLILWEKAFKPAGFSWGNRFNDAMHYELIK